MRCAIRPTRFGLLRQGERSEGIIRGVSRRPGDMMPPEEDNDLLFCSADTAAELRRWLTYLGAERRMSPKTVEAYERDVRQFLGFLAEHTGEQPTLKALAGIEPR